MICIVRRLLHAFSACAIVVSALAPHAARADAPPSAARYYAEAVRAMGRLPVPPYLTYHVRILENGKKPDLYQYRLRTRDGRAVDRLLPRGAWQLDPGHLFDPTWAGAYDLVQYGLKAFNDRTKAPSPSPMLHAKVDGMKIIAIVSAVAPSAYRISDRGAALCPNGAPGHALHLDAIRDPKEHMLSHVVIESATGRFCSMRFSFGASVIALGLTGYIDLHFGAIDRYWLVRDARIFIGARSFGVQVAHDTLGVAYRAMAFPAALPDALFVVGPRPSPSPTRAQLNGE